MCINYPPYAFFGAYCAICRGDYVCMLKNILIFCGYIGLQLLSNYLKKFYLKVAQ